MTVDVPVIMQAKVPSSSSCTENCRDSTSASSRSSSSHACCGATRRFVVQKAVHDAEKHGDEVEIEAKNVLENRCVTWRNVHTEEKVDKDVMDWVE